MFSPKTLGSSDISSAQKLLDRNSGHSSSFRWSESDTRKWPVTPQVIEKWNSTRVLSVLLDVSLLGLALCFAAFGITVKSYEGSSVDNSTYQMLARMAQLAPTVFPILFAAIVSRALKAIALWRLEEGASLGYLDQLVGSTSITTTVTTQFKLRAANILGLALIAIWGLSPLGGQGSIRILGTATEYTNTSTQVQFLNLTFFPWQYQSGDTGGFAQSNALFAASLSSPAKIRSSATDAWGNVKIPVLEMLNASDVDVDGWIGLSSTAEIEYASLIGLPFSTLATGSNIYFTMETSYWHLDCPKLFETDLDPAVACNISGWFDASTYPALDTGMHMSSRMGHLPDSESRSAIDCRQLAYCGWDITGATTANCTLQNSYVEVEVHCTGFACGVSRIRESRAAHPPVCWTQLDDEQNFAWYATPLVTALGRFHDAFVTTYQGYLVRPMDPFDLAGLDPVHTLAPDTFALRLSQLMNTYWYAFLGSTAIQYGITNQDLNRTIYIAPASGDSVVELTSGVVETSRVVISCDHAWLAVLGLAIFVLVGVSVAGIVATSLSIGPEISFNVSSMIKDSPHITLPFGGSALPASDRARMLKYVRVRYGDVDGDDDVGSIAIATPRATALRKDRLYA